MSQKLKHAFKRLNMEFDYIVNNVMTLLENHPLTRDRDNLLIALYWRTFDDIELPVNQISKATHAEHIRRARQYIQSPKGLHKLRPSKKVAVARSRAAYGFRTMFEGQKKLTEDLKK